MRVLLYGMSESGVIQLIAYWSVVFVGIIIIRVLDETTSFSDAGVAVLMTLAWPVLMPLFLLWAVPWFIGGAVAKLYWRVRRRC